MLSYVLVQFKHESAEDHLCAQAKLDWSSAMPLPFF